MVKKILNEINNRKFLRWGLLFSLLVACLGSLLLWHYFKTHEETDDAYIAGHVVPISAKVSGNVATILVKENQFVKENTPLIQMDPVDYQVKVNQAKAALASAEGDATADQSKVLLQSGETSSQLEAANATKSQFEASVNEAVEAFSEAKANLIQQNEAVNAAHAKEEASKALLVQASLNYQRMKRLRQEEFVSQADLDQAEAQYKTSKAQFRVDKVGVLQAEAAVISGKAKLRESQNAVQLAKQEVNQAIANIKHAQAESYNVTVSQAQLQADQQKVKQAEANLKAAELNLSYTQILAPVSGTVGNKTVQIGEVIQPDQPLLAIIPLDDVWVMANYKETQLYKIHAGDPATIKVDAYPGRVFHGHVDSIEPASGAVFSLLPPENATGNFVKVVQRIPIKILIDPKDDLDKVLRPGMSVIATVLTKP